MIYAADLNGGIGYNNGLPWPHLECDMKWFKRHTEGNIVVMGSTTWKSLPSKLPGRINVVLSREEIEGPDHVMRGTPEEVLKQIRDLYPGKNISIIGGGLVYDQYSIFCDQIHTTLVQDKYAADTFYDIHPMLMQGYKVTERIEVPETPFTPGVVMRTWQHPIQ